MYTIPFLLLWARLSWIHLSFTHASVVSLWVAKGWLNAELGWPHSQIWCGWGDQTSHLPLFSRLGLVIMVAGQDSKRVTDTCNPSKGLDAAVVHCRYLHSTCQQFSSDSRSREIDFVSLVKENAKPNCKKPYTRSYGASWPVVLSSPTGGIFSIYYCISARLIYIEYCNKQPQNLGGGFLVHNSIQ